MPCHYRIFTHENLIAKSFCGRITTRCVLKLLDDIEADPRYRDGMLEFDDLTRVEDLDITATDIMHFADLVVGMEARKRKPTRKAILAGYGPGQVAAHGFCKMVEGAEKYEARVFENLSDAISFLGISNGAIFRKSLMTGVTVN